MKQSYAKVLFASILLCSVLFTSQYYFDSGDQAAGLKIEVAELLPAYKLFNTQSETLNLDRPAVLLELNKRELKRLYLERPKSMVFKLPQIGGGIAKVSLERKQVLADGFSIKDGNGASLEFDPGVHYRSTSPDSAAAISIFKEQVIGFVTTQDGNFSLSKDIERQSYKEDMLYSYRLDADLAQIDCSTVTPEGHEAEMQRVLAKAKDSEQRGLATIDPVVKVYAELENEVFNNFVSLDDAEAYVLALFNQTGLIFEIEQVKLQLSEARIWTSVDPYPESLIIQGILPDFEGMGTSFNGDLAILLARGTGGLAGTRGLCSRLPFSIAGIEGALEPFPNYSSTLRLVAHELGHNVGSPHTHDCVWGTSRDMRLDSCRTTSSSNCDLSPNQTTDGTIMSYCDDYSLLNGFGLEPGDLIRAFIADSDCLSEQSEYANCPLDTIFYHTTCISDDTPNDPGDDLYEVKMKIQSSSPNLGMWTALINGEQTSYPYNEYVSLPFLESWKAFTTVLIEDATTGCQTVRKIHPAENCTTGEDCVELKYSARIGIFQEERAEDVIATDDGGSIIVGSNYVSFISPNIPDPETAGLRIFKLDEVGVLLWEIKESSIGFGELYSVTKLIDGHYVATGRTTRNGERKGSPLSQFAIIKFTTDGVLLWKKTYGGNLADNTFGITAAPDGGIVVVGTTASSDYANGPSTGTARTIGFAAKFDTNGNQLWATRYGAGLESSFSSIVALRAGGYAMAGTVILPESFSTRGERVAIRVVRIDETGDIKLIDALLNTEPNFTETNDIVETLDGNLVLAAFTSADNSAGGFVENLNCWLFKVDAIAGDEIWRSNTNYSLFRNFDSYGVVEKSDGGFYTMVDESIGYRSYINVQSIGQSGKVIWEKTMVGFGSPKGGGIALRDDGSLIGVGYTSAGSNLPANYGPNDFWVFELGPNLCDEDANPCIVTPYITDTSCDDSGTPENRLDDTYTVELRVLGDSICGTTFSISSLSATYGETVTLGPFLIRDGDQTILVSNDGANNASRNFTLPAPRSCSALDVDQVDLELTSSVASIDPPANTTFPVSFTITNDGNSDETDVVVKVSPPRHLVPQGGNEASTTQGFFSTSNYTWYVGDLDAKSSATVTLGFFNPSITPSVIYAQVINQGSNDDYDSEADNGTAPAPQEDDEAAILLNGGSTSMCEINFMRFPRTCSDNGTPNDPSDDTYTVDIYIRSNINCSSGWVGENTSAPYGEAGTVGPFNIADGRRNLTFYDSMDSTVTLSFSTVPPLPCSDPQACSISSSVTNITCNDAGTPNQVNDDFWGFDLLVTSSGSCASGWTSSIANGRYGETVTVGPFLVINGDLDFSIADANMAAVMTTVFESPPSPCIDPNSVVDLSLGLSVDVPNPGIGRNAPLQLTVTNEGIAQATNVIVEFIDQSDSLTQAQFRHVSSEHPGNTQFDYVEGIWTLPMIDPGETVLLDYTGFSSTTAQIPIFAQVIAQDQPDSDSTPGNGSASAALEDDEVLFVLNTQVSSTQSADEVAAVKLFPNPAKKYVNLELGSWAKSEGKLELRNAIGQLSFESSWIELSQSIVRIETSSYAAGHYTVALTKPGETLVLPLVLVK